MKRKQEQEQQQEQEQEHVQGQERGRMPGIVTVAKSASDFLGIDYDIVFKPCRKAAGSTIEAIVLLMEHMRPTFENEPTREWSDDELKSILLRVQKCRYNVELNEILRHTWSNTTPYQLRELLRAMQKPTSTLIASPDAASSEFNDSELQTGWFTIIHATRIGGSNTSRFSDYVLGMRIDEDVHDEPRWVPIGKVAGRPEHSLALQIDTLLVGAVLERFGPTVSIRPEAVVVEVRHRGFRENRRTKAGKVLAEPEITRLLD